ncbi:hypothetical protein [Gemmata sp.]|uniref:hypothetical protein n=1 Tax=Gemmata sp. TaxID=1914242 RepID=UPI003F72892F
MAEQRKKNEDALLLALACGASVEAAARQGGLTDPTIYRRLSEPAFTDRLRALHTDMVARAAGLLTAAAGEAVRTLLQLQKDAPATVRLGAARAVLELGMKLREVADLEARMAALEARLADQDPPGPRGLYA